MIENIGKRGMFGKSSSVASSAANFSPSLLRYAWSEWRVVFTWANVFLIIGVILCSSGISFSSESSWGTASVLWVIALLLFVLVGMIWKNMIQDLKLAKTCLRDGLLTPGIVYSLSPIRVLHGSNITRCGTPIYGVLLKEYENLPSKYRIEGCKVPCGSSFGGKVDNPLTWGKFFPYLLPHGTASKEKLNACLTHIESYGNSEGYHCFDVLTKCIEKNNLSEDEDVMLVVDTEGNLIQTREYNGVYLLNTIQA